MRTPQEHPSNRLSSGAVSGFEEALQLVVQEHADEHDARERQPATVSGWRTWSRIKRSEQALAQVRAATSHAGQVYREEQEAARLRTVARLQQDALAAEAALDDEAARWLGLLATALESGDDSGLAI